MGTFIPVEVILILPDACKLVSPERIDRIALLVSVKILGTVARIHIGRNHCITFTYFKGHLTVVGDGKSRVPFEVLAHEVLALYSQLHSHVSCRTDIVEICIVTRNLRSPHRKQKIVSIRQIGIRFYIQPASEGLKVKADII